MTRDSYLLVPIGLVHSSFTTCREVPLSGGPAELEVFPEFARALDGLEASSHLVVMTFLHLADRRVLSARPRKVDPEAPARGVFATRSPARPNPVSVTVVPILARHGRRIEVDRLDVADGTPLIDLKAYCPGADGVFSATHVSRTTPDRLDDARLVPILEQELENHLGRHASEPAARAALAAVYRAVRHFGEDARSPGLTVSTNRLDAGTEALSGLTGAGFANGRLRFEPAPGPRRIRFELNGRGLLIF